MATLSPERLHNLPKLGRRLRPLLVGRARNEQERQVALSARTCKLAGELTYAVSAMMDGRIHLPGGGQQPTATGRLS